MAGNNQGTRYLSNILTLTSGDDYTLAIQGRIEGSKGESEVYSCPVCHKVYTLDQMTNNGDGTYTLTCTTMINNPDYVDPTPASDSGEETAALAEGDPANTTDPMIPDYIGAPHIETVVTGDVALYRDVIAWGDNTYGQLGKADGDTSANSPAIYVTMTGTERDEDGKDIDLLKIYAGGHTSATIYAPQLGEKGIDPLTNMLKIWGRNDQYQAGAGYKNGSALTGDPVFQGERPLQGHSHNDTTEEADVSYKGYFNRAVNVTLSEETTTAVQYDGSVWSWGSDANYHRGDYNRGGVRSTSPPPAPGQSIPTPTARCPPSTPTLTGRCSPSTPGAAPLTPWARMRLRTPCPAGSPCGPSRRWSST